MDIQQQTTDTYNKIAHDYNTRNHDHFWVEEFNDFVKLVNGKNIVDLGCGAGRDAVQFVSHGFDYTGLDASQGMLDIARERAPEGKFIEGDLRATNFTGAIFDGFWAAASFLHLPKKDIAQALQEARRITKQGGIGFIVMKEKAEMDEGIITEEKFGGISRYFSFYTQEEFKQVLELNGFTILRMSTHEQDDPRKTQWLCFLVKV